MKMYCCWLHFIGNKIKTQRGDEVTSVRSFKCVWLETWHLLVSDGRLWKTCSLPHGVARSILRTVDRGVSLWSESTLWIVSLIVLDTDTFQLKKKKWVLRLKASLELSHLLQPPSPFFQVPSPVYFTSKVSLLLSVLLIIAFPTGEPTLGSLAWPSRLCLP